MAAARSHSFFQLAQAIDAAFARWDLAHMHMFTLAGGTPVSELDQWDGVEPEGTLDSRATKLSRLQPGEQFAYVFDFGDDWAHLCTVGAERIDPLHQLGIVPDQPLAFWGWGTMPDQYGRRWAEDDGMSEVPKRPKTVLADLPPILPWWGPQAR